MNSAVRRVRRNRRETGSVIVIALLLLATVMGISAVLLASFLASNKNSMIFRKVVDQPIAIQSAKEIALNQIRLEYGKLLAAYSTETYKYPDLTLATIAETYNLTTFRSVNLAALPGATKAEWKLDSVSGNTGNLILSITFADSEPTIFTFPISGSASRYRQENGAPVAISDIPMDLFATNAWATDTLTLGGSSRIYSLNGTGRVHVEGTISDSRSLNYTVTANETLGADTRDRCSGSEPFKSECRTEIIPLDVSALGGSARELNSLGSILPAGCSTADFTGNADQVAAWLQQQSLGPVGSIAGRKACVTGGTQLTINNKLTLPTNSRISVYSVSQTPLGLNLSATEGLIGGGDSCTGPVAEVTSFAECSRPGRIAFIGFQDVQVTGNFGTSAFIAGKGTCTITGPFSGTILCKDVVVNAPITNSNSALSEIYQTLGWSDQYRLVWQAQ